jgi:hypothetical protein
MAGRCVGMSIQTRPIRALLGFMTRDEALQFQSNICHKTPSDTDESCSQRWEMAVSQLQKQAPITNLDIESRALSKEAQAAADEISD